jgi:hypothetical protein
MHLITLHRIIESGWIPICGAATTIIAKSNAPANSFGLGNEEAVSAPTLTLQRQHGAQRE